MSRPRAETPRAFLASVLRMEPKHVRGSVENARDDRSAALNGEHDVSTVSYTSDDIQRRMAEIRRDLHKDVRDVVASAEAATDWRRYLTMYPWVSLGAAFAVGYLVVPRRQHAPSATDITPGAEKQIRAAIDSLEKEPRPPKRRRVGVIGTLWSLAGPVATRAAQSYAAQFLERQLSQYEQSVPSGDPNSEQNRGREWRA